MKLIKQRHATSCGPTCVAMVLNIPYSKALKLIHPKHTKHTQYATPWYKISSLLKRKKINFEIKYPSKIPRYKRYKAIISVQWTYGGRHWVVWDPDSQSILDPGGQILHGNKYQHAFKRGCKRVIVIKD